MNKNKAAIIFCAIYGVIIFIGAFSQSQSAIGWQYYQSMKGGQMNESVAILPFIYALLLAVNIYILWRVFSSEKGKKIYPLITFIIGMAIIAAVQSSYIPNVGNIEGGAVIIGGMLAQVLSYIIPIIAFIIIKKKYKEVKNISSESE